jgi:hypothetical protein
VGQARCSWLYGVFAAAHIIGLVDRGTGLGATDGRQIVPGAANAGGQADEECTPFKRRG